MKKFLDSRDGASRGAALIIVLALVVLSNILSFAYLARSNIDRQLARSSYNDSMAGNISIDRQRGNGTIYNSERAMATSPDVGCFVVASAQIVSSGNFYKVGDYLDPGFGTLCAPGDNYGFRLRVNSIDSPDTGHVTGVSIVPGIGYSVPPSNPVAFGGSASGTGFTANCTFNASP